MKRRHRWLIRFLAAGAAFVFRAWLWTTRMRLVISNGGPDPKAPGRGRALYAVWHENLMATFAVGAKIRFLISKHADGELIARMCAYLGVEVVRGSSKRGGEQALLAMIRNNDSSVHLGITPDGPRGPRRKCKPGAILLASRSGLPIVPVGVGYVRAYRCSSWDSFAIAWPGSTMILLTGAPISIPPHLDRTALRQWSEIIERQINELTDSAAEWAVRIRNEGAGAAPPALPSAGEPLRWSA